MSVAQNFLTGAPFNIKYWKNWFAVPYLSKLSKDANDVFLFILCNDYSLRLILAGKVFEKQFWSMLSPKSITMLFVSMCSKWYLILCDQQF